MKSSMPGEAFGMTTFDKFIVGLYEKGQITEDTAMAYASRKGIVGRGLDMVKARPRGSYH